METLKASHHTRVPSGPHFMLDLEDSIMGRGRVPGHVFWDSPESIFPPWPGRKVHCTAWDVLLVCFPKLGVPTIMENQMEKNMENEMETGVISESIGLRVSQN